MDEDPEVPSIVDPSDAVDPLVLTVDVGTSSARALVYDRSGRIVRGCEAHRPYTVSTTPDGGVTADPDALLDLVASAIDDVMVTLRASGRRVAAVSADTFWHSLVGVDPKLASATPVYTWADTRSSAAATRLRAELDEATVHSRTGAGIHTSYWPAKLRWLSESDPQTVSRVAYWMSFAEYLYLRLFGQRSVSLSMASGTGLFDQNACDWDQELLRVLPISADQLSPLTDFSQALGSLTPEFSRRWPPLADIPWYLPIGDGAANNVGSGGFDEKWIVAMIGTSGAIRVVRKSDHVEIPPGIWTYRVDSRRFVQGGALSAGGNVFAWLEQTFQLDPVATLEKELLVMAPDGHGLTVLPFLVGERSPDWNSRARGAIVGLSIDTTAVDIVRAFLEAVAYRFGIVYGILQQVISSPRGIIGSGAGLIHSPAWLQIMADVLAEPLIVSAAPEATSRGAALLALEAMGAIADLGDVPAPLGMTYQPQAGTTAKYRNARERQERLYELLVAGGTMGSTGQGIDHRFD